MIGVTEVRTATPAADPRRAGAAVLRLSLAEFTAVANSIPRLAVPEGFRPGRRTRPISSAEVAESLAKRGLLLRDGDDVVLCPQLTGLLRVFDRAAVTFRLRVRLRDPDDDTHVRWLTDVALAEGRGVRLTRATVLEGPGPDADGAMDGDAVAVSGFPLQQTVPQLLGCVPGLDSLDVDPDDRPQRQVVDVVDLGTRGREQDLGAMTLEIRSRAWECIDVWSHDGLRWRHVLPDGAGHLVLTAVRRDALAAQLTDVLTESVLVDQSGTEAQPVDGGAHGS